MVVSRAAQQDHFLAIRRHLPSVNDSDQSTVARIVALDVTLQEAASVDDVLQQLSCGCEFIRPARS